MADPIIAPYAQTYTQHTPYLSLDEYKLSPNAVDTSRLAPGKDAAAQDAALANVIVAASGWADEICHQVLAATPEVWAGFPRLQADGSARIPLPFSPLIAVTSLAVGSGPQNLTECSSLVGIVPDRKVVTVPAALLGAEFPSPTPFRSTSGPYVSVGYVAGFANGYLQAQAGLGTSALVLDNATGVFPGMTLTVNDPGASSYETVTVASVDGTTVALTAPLVAEHAVGVNVSALPPAVKQAVILLTNAQIKKRSSYAIQMNGAQQKGDVVQSEPTGRTEELTATRMLSEWMRVV